MKKTVAFFLTMVFLLCSLVACGGEQKNIQPSISQMRSICELSVMECYYHNVAKCEEENAQGMLWWTKDKRFWVEYDAVVTLGIDVSLVNFSISGNVVTITIPDAELLNYQVLSESLTEDAYIIEKNSAKIDAEDETMAFQQAQIDLETNVSNDKGLLMQAQQQAQLLLEEYIDNFGEAVGQEYTVEWEYLSASEDTESQPQEDPASQEAP